MSIVFAKFTTSAAPSTSGGSTSTAILSSDNVFTGQNTFSGAVSTTKNLATNGLVYETVTDVGGAVNAYTLDYAVGGIYSIPPAISPTANFTITITNIPTSHVQSYTFTVGCYQAATRYYASQVKVQDTASAYILGTSGAFAVPMFNGGTPALTGTTPCLVAQQFTVFPVSGSQYVMSSVSACSTTAAAGVDLSTAIAIALAGTVSLGPTTVSGLLTAGTVSLGPTTVSGTLTANTMNINYTTLPTLAAGSIGYQYSAIFNVNIPAGTGYTSQLGSFPAGVYYCEAAGGTGAVPTIGTGLMFYFTAAAININQWVGNQTGVTSTASNQVVGVPFSCSGVYVCPNAGDLKFVIYNNKPNDISAASGGSYKITRIA